MKATIYHNSRCSKSRATLALLEGRRVDIEIIEYLKTPLSKTALQELLAKLQLKPRDLLRTSEAEFKAAGILQDASDDELLDLMVEHPKIMQRPIVEVGNRARLGRPPEQVLELLK